MPPVPVAPGPDASDPFARAAAPRGASPAPSLLVLDEETLKQARTTGRKQGLFLFVLLSFVCLGFGYVLGAGVTQNALRNTSLRDASELAVEIEHTQKALTTLAVSLQGGVTQLKANTFPVQLAQQLSVVVLGFESPLLAGRHFSSFPREVSGGLIEFYARLQTMLVQRKGVINLLTTLQKPLTEAFSAPPPSPVVLKKGGGKKAELESVPAPNPSDAQAAQLRAQLDILGAALGVVGGSTGLLPEAARLVEGLQRITAP